MSRDLEASSRSAQALRWNCMSRLIVATLTVTPRPVHNMPGLTRATTAASTAYQHLTSLGSTRADVPGLTQDGLRHAPLERAMCRQAELLVALARRHVLPLSARH